MTELDINGLLQMVVPGLIGFLGGLAPTLLLLRREERREAMQERRSVMERRVNEFYAPMVARVKTIRYRSSLRFALHQAIEQGRAQIPKTQHDQVREQVTALLDYDRVQFETEMMPLYEEMVALCAEKYFLADPDVRAHFEELHRFVELWRRHLKGAVPLPAALIMGPKEAPLLPLYDLLEKRLIEYTFTPHSNALAHLRSEDPA